MPYFFRAVYYLYYVCICVTIILSCSPNSKHYNVFLQISIGIMITRLIIDDNNKLIEAKICRSLRDLSEFAVRRSARTRLTLSPSTFSKFSSGTITLSIRIMPVTDSLRENFPSIFGVAKRSRAFSLSTMKPRILLSSHFAQIINTSAMGEFVILNKIRDGSRAQYLLFIREKA